MDNQVFQILLMLAAAALSYATGRAQAKAKKEDEKKDAKEKILKEMADNYKRLVDGQEELLKHYREIKLELQEVKRSNKRLKEGGLVLLRDRIIQSCRVFIERGSVTLTARNNIRDMYKVYHDEFDGNGDGEYYFTQMEKLPIDDIPIVSSIR